MPSSSKKNRKRKLPGGFLDCPSLSQVSDFPSKEGDSRPARVLNTNVASETTKGIFLDRFAKEIIKPFRPPPSIGGASFVMVNGTLKRQAQSASKKTTDTKVGVLQERLVMGTNQCLRILENAMQDKQAPRPSLMVLARDVYPPTMLAHAPAMAKRLEIPVLLLPGKASNEIGEAVGIKKTSILLFLPSTTSDEENKKVNSFVEFVISNMAAKEEKL